MQERNWYIQPTPVLTRPAIQRIKAVVFGRITLGSASFTQERATKDPHAKVSPNTPFR